MNEFDIVNCQFCGKTHNKWISCQMRVNAIPIEESSIRAYHHGDDKEQLDRIEAKLDELLELAK